MEWQAILVFQYAQKNWENNKKINQNNKKENRFSKKVHKKTSLKITIHKKTNQERKILYWFFEDKML